jgi:hypothetical protein
MAKEKEKVNLHADGDLIRSAFRSGKKTVMIRGTRFKLALQKRRRKITMGGGLNKDYPRVEVKINDEWILASPANGGLLPVYSVARSYGKNGIAQIKPKKV